MVSENRVSLSHTDRTSKLGVVRPSCHDGPYIQSRYRMSAMWVLRENLIFSPLPAYSLTPRAIRNTLMPPSLVYNFHAM
jgi:hypothetical protein